MVDVVLDEAGRSQLAGNRPGKELRFGAVGCRRASHDRAKRRGRHKRLHPTCPSSMRLAQRERMDAVPFVTRHSPAASVKRTLVPGCKKVDSIARTSHGDQVAQVVALRLIQQFWIAQLLRDHCETAPRRGTGFQNGGKLPQKNEIDVIFCLTAIICKRTLSRWQGRATSLFKRLGCRLQI